ncbi:dienelactone hydrolase family protein [Pararoseomonas indoligenes]|uniref:Dienelactone hydrolase family protein n=1 Tax=Roseomonas indoligenes TaxID=2820811 RepID=A0A940MXH6_9PROT|nr:dienelactone hydrolase family protein [Pararoseomonas indoligenes]MBP0492286.1 dienelactone hydrolase family protein [Pararoseomonas indoligenes]
MKWLLPVALLAALPAAAADPVTLPGPGGVALRGLLVRPAGAGQGIPVIALHGCGGLGGPGTPLSLPAREADWAARLAALGHPVLFPDSFGSRGVTQVCSGGEKGILPETTRRADAHAAAAWAAAQPWSAPGGAFLLGWSHGGSTALAAIGAPVPTGLLRGAVALYPGCARPGQPPPPWQPAAPVLMLLGGADDWTPPGHCRLAAERARPAPVELVEYPGAAHGFDQPSMPPRTLSGLDITARGDGTARMGTDEAARADALRRVPAFLAAHGGPAPR